eukprot:4068088-Pyramimonas_sp.AAC.2
MGSAPLPFWFCPCSCLCCLRLCFCRLCPCLWDAVASARPSPWLPGSGFLYCLRLRLQALAGLATSAGARPRAPSPLVSAASWCRPARRRFSRSASAVVP